MNTHYPYHIIQICQDKSSQQISKSANLSSTITEHTNFLNHIQKVSVATRIYCILNNVHSLPKCKKCDNEVVPNKSYAHLGFTEYCSSKCSRSDKTIDKSKLQLLQDKEWLYNQRIDLKKSKEMIADELGVSITPVNKWLKFHKIPDIKYNCSHPNSLLKISDKNWLEEQHKTNKKKCEEIAQELNISKSTVSIWLNKHNIESNDANSYDRKFIKTSKECTEVLDFIKSFYTGDIQVNKRGLLGPLELDIYLPDAKLAIEYNGVYSHLYRPEESNFSKRKDHKYHIHKTKLCEEQGIQLLHIFSDSWKDKCDIWKSFIKNKLSYTVKKVHARKCTIIEIDTYTKNAFLDENHLQGKDKSKVKYGLYNDDDLVCVMTFSKSRYSKKYDWELMRFAVKRGYSVSGGFTKLLSHFRRNNAGSIVSYADRTYSNGNVYISNGFKLDSINKPSYYYVKRNSEIRLHRSNFTKKSITDKNDTRTEEQIMFDNDYSKIFDCGTFTFYLD